MSERLGRRDGWWSHLGVFIYVGLTTSSLCFRKMTDEEKAEYESASES